MTETVTYSNPRLLAEFDDWPSGKARVKCRFQVEAHPKRGWRVLRTTTDASGRWCKPKATSYAGKAAIVDGSDGRTYVLQHAGSFDFVKIYRHDFLSARDGIFPADAEYAMMRALIAEANK